MTGLKDNCVNWALMGSSFHWTDSKLAVKEFYRILAPGGFFTAIWNPRDIESSELHRKIEDAVYEYSFCGGSACGAYDKREIYEYMEVCK